MEWGRKMKLTILLSALAICFFTCSPVHAEKIQAIDIEAQRLELIEQLKSKNIIGVEVLVAGAGDGLISSFGHTFLRLVAKDGDWGDDIVIGFLADPNRVYDDESTIKKIGKFKYYAGFISGRYPIAVQVSSLYDFWSQYVIKEKRSIERKIILSTHADRQSLIKNLDEMLLKHDEQLGNYSFLKRNCATVVIDLLNRSGFPRPVNRIISPSSILDYYSWSWIAPYPTLSFTNYIDAQELYEKAEVNLGDNLAKDEIIEKLTNHLSELEIKKLLVVGELKGMVLREMGKRFPFDRGVSYEEAVGVKVIPESAYQFCESVACAQEVFAFFFKDKTHRFLKHLLIDIKVAPAAKQTESMVYVGRELQKVKINHPFHSMGHELIIKNHYDFLRSVISSAYIKN